MCDKVGGSIQAHHIKPKYQHPEKIFETNNGITLCWGCHNKVHDEDLVEKKEKAFQKLAESNKPKPRVRKARKKKR